MTMGHKRLHPPTNTLFGYGNTLDTMGLAHSYNGFVKTWMVILHNPHLSKVITLNGKPNQCPHCVQLEHANLDGDVSKVVWSRPAACLKRDRAVKHSQNPSCFYVCFAAYATWCK